MINLVFTPEERAQEDEWARQLKESRTNLVVHVRKALALKSPTRRRELYQQWRKDYGDDRARTYAKYAEACIEGRVSIEPIERMIR